MTTKRAYHQPVYFSLIFMLIVSLTLAACGKDNATPTPSPTSAPKLPPTVKLTVSNSEGGAVTTLQEGGDTAILIDVQPYEELDWAWDVSGTSGGTLNSETGENVVYTAGKAGIDTVTARSKLADGTLLRQSVTINVEPAATQTPPPTETALPPRVTLTSLQNEQKVPCENIVSGTYPSGFEKDIWPIVLINGIYFPQDEGGKAATKVDGKWYQTVRFGDCRKPDQDRGKQFQLIIVVASESANDALEKYFTDAKITGNWGGIVELPSGAEEQVRIIVSRE